jgi:hypothetical protein
VVESRDSGRTWQPPRILNDTPVDDRDAGIVALGDDRLLVTMFAVDSRMYREAFTRRYGDHPEEARAMIREVDGWDNATVSAWVGSWVMLGRLGQPDPWPMYRAPVSSPHGPTLLQNGDLLYLGKHCGLPPHFDMGSGTIRTARSTDGGRSWTVEAQIPLAPGMEGGNVHEPHLTQLPDGTLVAMIRYEHRAGAANNYEYFSTFVSRSEDGGKTFSPMAYVCHGSPPHLLWHRGVLICSLGNRRPPYGQQVILSDDGGRSWSAPQDLFSGAPDADLGYPATAALPDGTLLTVYYQKFAPGEKCALLCTHWALE